MMQKIRSLLHTLGCKRTHGTENPLHMITNQGVRFIVLKSEHGYEICEDELHPEPFRFGFGLKEDLTIQDVKKTIDFIHELKHKYEKEDKEFLIINQRGFGKLINKLSELGVETIAVYTDKIIFIWRKKICLYENGAIYYGTKHKMLVENIYDLNTNGLDCLVGKLTDEQLERVGHLIDLFEDDLHHYYSKKDDLLWLEMRETPFYRLNDDVIETYERQVKKLKKTLQTGFMEEFKDNFIKNYINWGK